jgi:hypothetical protein
LWSSALGAFASHPLGGTGPGTFEFWWNRDVADGEPLTDAHSLPIETLAEAGLPGFVLLAGFLGGLLLLARRLARRARTPVEAGAFVALVGAFAVYLLSASVDWMWELTAISVLGIAAVAIAGAAGSQPRDARARMGGRRLAMVVVALVAGAIQVPGVVSTARTRDSLDALRLDFDARALDFANEAVTGEPWASDPYAQRALVEATMGRTAAALDDAQTAVDRESTNYAPYALLARLEAQAGHRAAALAAVREAIRLHPSGAGVLNGLRLGIEALPQGGPAVSPP